MSAETTPQSDATGTAVGSPSSAEPLTQGGEGASSDAGASPDPDAKAAGEDPAAENERLRGELAASNAKNTDYEKIVNVVLSDDDLADDVIARATGRPKKGGAEAKSKLNELVAKKFGGDPGVAEAMAEIVQAAVDEAVQQAVGRIEPGMRALQSTNAETVFERTLTSHGVPPDVQGAAAFNRHLRDLQSDPDFRKLPPAFAAKMAAKTWGAQSRDANVAAQKRLADAKGSQTNRSSARGTASASEIHTISRHDVHAMLRLKQAGVPRSNIKYRD